MLLEQRYNPKSDLVQSPDCSPSLVNADTDTTISIDEPLLSLLPMTDKPAINRLITDEHNSMLYGELPLPHMLASPLEGTNFDLAANYPDPFGQEFDIDQQADYLYSISLPPPSISGNLCSLDDMPYLATPENSPTSTTSDTFYQVQYASSLGVLPSLFPQATSPDKVAYCTSKETVRNPNTTSEQFMQWHQNDNRIVDGTLEEGKAFKKYPEFRSDKWAGPNSTISTDINRIVFSEEAVEAQLKRQVHIQTEQKRRAQIKDGFEELKRYLPSFINKKVSKAAILRKTIQYLQQLKANYLSVLKEYDNVVAENLKLKNLLATNTGAPKSEDHLSDNPSNLTNGSSVAPLNPTNGDTTLGH